SGGFAATNALLYSDDFESYTNGTPLIDTNYWFSSSYEDGSGVFFATVVSNADLAPAGSTNLAAIPIEVTLSNRYATNLPNTWLHTRTKIVTYDGATNVINYDTNAAAAFYFDSNGYCVVRDGTNGWVTVTQTLDGQPAEPVDTNSFITIDLFLDYTNKVWRLNLNSVSITNNIRFINPALTNWGGFTVYNYGLSTTYIDKVSLYALPALSVAPPVLTNTVFYQGTATNQHFQVISRGEGQLNYAVVTNAVSPGWSMTIVSNAVGSLTNAATNAVWIAYDTASLSPGVYTNSFTVMSTNLESESQTVQVVMNVCRMEVSPSNFSAAALRGYDADSQTIYVSAGGGDMPFSVSTDAGWLSVNPSSGYITGSATNVLTNTYLTSALNPGDYTGRITVAATAGGGDTGTVSVSLRVFSTPVLSAAPGSISQVIDKGANPTGEYFEVWNSSATPRLGMAYHVSVNDPGNIIQGVSPADGVSSGEHYTVGIYFRNVSGYEAGSYTANVAIAATNYGAGYAGHWSGTNNVKVVLLIGAPSAPARVTATEGDYEDRVAVTWTPVVSPTGGEVTYNVLRHTTFDPEYAEVIVSGLTVTNYDDETVSAGLRYYYWVQSVNSHGQAGAKSLYAGGYRRLSAPSGLFASDGLYTNRVVVNWAEVDFATGYRVYRSAGGSPAFAYYTTETEYHDLQAEEGVEYTYYVQSTNSICASTVSAGEKGYILSRPFAISASAGQYVNKVRISWSAVKGASAYELWKSTENIAPPYGGGSKIAETAALAYNDTAVTPGKKYYYWLKSMSATALSAFSARAEGYAATATADLLPWGLVI
ncbi:MAG: hypothetical protein PHP98_07415, partial [Kiritimatiellae bacterium]|nr:hypothetical protein [Kiritimatiellia bacterium]